MEAYKIQPVKFEQSEPNNIAKKEQASNLDVNYDKDIANVKFTVKSVMAVSKNFREHEISKLMNQPAIQEENCL